MQVLYDNKILSAVLTRSSENPAHPIANVQDTKILKTFRTLGASAEWIKASTTITASRFAIMGHNLSASADIHLQGNDSDVWTAPAFDEEVTWKSGIIIHSFVECTYNYWRLIITDSGNSYISIGELYLGTYLQLPNIKPDAEIGYNTTGSADKSASGQLYGDEGYEYRSVTVNFWGITDAQRAGMIAWWSLCRNSRPFLMLVWANREDLETAMYCHIDQNGIAWKRTGNDKFPWSTTIKYEECF